MKNLSFLVVLFTYTWLSNQRCHHR